MAHALRAWVMNQSKKRLGLVAYGTGLKLGWWLFIFEEKIKIIKSVKENKDLHKYGNRHIHVGGHYDGIENVFIWERFITNEINSNFF